MPDWLEIGRLDVWEEHVQGILPAGDLQGPVALLNDVFEFGRLNLYCAFQPENTAREFRRLVARLAQQGLAVDEKHPVANW